MRTNLICAIAGLIFGRSTQNHKVRLHILLVAWPKLNEFVACNNIKFIADMLSSVY